MRPDLSRVGAWYHGYINTVKENDLNQAFTNQTEAFLHFLNTIPPAKYDYRYAEGKWTIREVLQHVIDAERIFAYRALCFARKDSTPLPAFDENLYADNAKANTRNWQDLVDEFNHVRRSSEILFRSFDEEQLQSNGIASNSPSYTLAVGYTLIGHSVHHMRVTSERYLEG